MAALDHPLHVVVKFGSDIPYSTQCSAMLQFERDLREKSGRRVEVFKESRGDDSKPRMAMTKEQRAGL